MNFNDKVYKISKRIPKGKVTTYGDIACALKTKAYQAVGNAMRNNPYAPEVPCHRVVKSDGSIGGFRGEVEGEAIKDKITMLKKEGVIIENNKVKDFENKRYRF